MGILGCMLYKCKYFFSRR